MADKTATKGKADTTSNGSGPPFPFDTFNNQLLALQQKMVVNEHSVAIPLTATLIVPANPMRVYLGFFDNPTTNNISISTVPAVTPGGILLFGNGDRYEWYLGKDGIWCTQAWFAIATFANKTLTWFESIYRGDTTNRRIK